MPCITAAWPDWPPWAAAAPSPAPARTKPAQNSTMKAKDCARRMASIYRFPEGGQFVGFLGIEPPSIDAERILGKDIGPAEFVPEESSDDSSEDEELSEGESGYRREDRDFKEHIHCVTLKKFSILRDLIKKNDFKSLAKDEELLESLGLIMYGVKRGFIPICSSQRLVLTNSQKELLYRIARNPSGRLVMKERRDLSLLFEVLWKSVKYVADVFQEYN